MYIDPRRRSPVENEPKPQLSSNAPSPAEEHVERDFPDLPARETPELVAFYQGLAKITATTADTPTMSADDVRKAKIDRVRDAYSGPFRAEGSTVSAPPMFRMWAHGPRTRGHDAELNRLVGKEIAASVRSGQAPPALIVKATQALIDAGKLPPGPGDLPARIKKMQWEWGVGIDCACFTREALTAVSEKSIRALGVHEDLGLRALDANPHFTRLEPHEVRAGDVITLDPLPPETVGHNVIVRDRQPIADAERDALVRKHGAAARAFFASAGPFHSIEVDSAWGAGERGNVTGGYRRDTWIYDESAKHWAFFDPNDHTFQTSNVGPAYSDKLHHAYRIK